MALGLEILSENRAKLCNTLRKVMSWIHAKGSAVERIVLEAEAVEQWKVLPYSHPLPLKAFMLLYYFFFSVGILTD